MAKAAKAKKKNITINKKFLRTVHNLHKCQQILKENQELESQYKSDLKDYATEEWCNLYEAESTNPKAIEFTFDDIKLSSSFVFTPKESSTKLDKITASKLSKKYGSDILSKTISYEVNAAFIEQNYETLINLMEENKDLFKMNGVNEINEVIKVNETYKLNKSLDSMGDFNKNKEVSFKVMLEDFSPVFAISDVDSVLRKTNDVIEEEETQTKNESLDEWLEKN